MAAVERELVGGECSYWACIPSKAMLRPVVAVADALKVNGARQAVTGPGRRAWRVRPARRVGDRRLPFRASAPSHRRRGGVGVEMASASHGLGSSVTLLAQADGLLPRLEPFVGEIVARTFTAAGIDVRIGATVTGIRRPGGTGPVTLTLEGGR